MQKLVGLWRALAPSIDMIGPDIYTDNTRFDRAVMAAYHRPDNPLWIPEIGRDDNYGKFFFYALGQGAIGFAPFGVDQTGWNILGDQPWKSHGANFALIGPMSREIAQLEFDGKLKTAVEEPGQTTQELDFGELASHGVLWFSAVGWPSRPRHQGRARLGAGGAAWARTSFW